MKRRIDLNADLGESENPKDIARDIAIMDIVTSVNIACGGHAGSNDTMKIMLKAAAKRGVAAGAHPSYPDRENFGRVSMQIDTDNLSSELFVQVDTILNIARKLDVQISHVKPHGALYNDAADKSVIADIIASALSPAIADAMKTLPIMGLASGAMRAAADERGCKFIPEAFIDRRYTPQGKLVPRGEAGAVIESNEERIAQALSIAKDGRAAASNGEEIVIDAQTLCLHSDSDGALETARSVRRALEDAGIEIAAPV